MDTWLSKDDVVVQLWNAYKKSSNYKSEGMIEAIPPHHPLVEDQEKNGLREIYNKFISSLENTLNTNQQLRARTTGDWLEEWKDMHKLLFHHIIKECGGRRKDDVRFGDSGDEDLYKIPKVKEVPNQIAELAYSITQLISKDYQEIEEQSKVLAKIHYAFIRIHPFSDGNDRIARAITDQLAVYFGLPPAMSGYPRHDAKRRENYHKAIRSCITDPECIELAVWIRGYIDLRLNDIA